MSILSFAIMSKNRSLLGDYKVFRGHLSSCHASARSGEILRMTIRLIDKDNWDEHITFSYNNWGTLQSPTLLDETRPIKVRLQ